MKTIDQTILDNLLIEREFCIAKIQFTTRRLELLEVQIEEQRKVVEWQGVVR